MGGPSKSLSSQASLYFLGRVAALIVHFLVPIILVRIFVKSDFGQFAQFLLIYNFFYTVLQFGMRQSLFYFLPLQNESKSYYVTNTLILLTIGGVICFLILTILRNNIAYLFNADDLSLLLPLCGLHTLFMLISCPFETILITEKKAEKASIIVFASQIVRGVFIIVFVMIYKTVFSAAIGIVCYSFIRFIAYSLFVHKHIGIKLDTSSIKHLKQQFQYAVPIGFSGIISNTYKRIDRFILAIFFTPDIYAIYRIGKFKMPFGELLFQSVGEVALPRAVELLKDKKVDQFLELWKKLLVRFSYIGIGTFFVFQVLAYDLITLMFTSQYEASVPVFRVLLCFTLGAMFQYSIILKAIGNTKAIFKSNLLAFIFTVPATYILVKNFGLLGAAAAALSGFFLNVISQLVYSVKGLKRKYTEVFPVSTMVKFLMIAAALFALLFTLQELIPYRVVRILFSGSTFSIAYIIICWKTKIYSIFEEKLFRKIIRRMNLVKA
ncbi:MAG: oligosaccharide flippase family protein [Bacteroidetes bacterium]|nr:oligosaccharide flippase family protein [Bacteroidota bacterium]